MTFFEEINADSNTLMNRRAFIRQGVQFWTQKILGYVEQQVEPVLKGPFLRPPGALPEPLFLSFCTRCDACTAACPYEAISVQYGAGPLQDGTPVLLNLREHPCLLCEETPCISACPTGALSPVDSIRQIKIGSAVIDGLRCSAYRGSGCQTCYEVCPIQDEAIQLIEGLPIVIPDACTGCGICQHHCPEEPAAIQVFLTLAQAQF
jgi:ferredoxin-type protein NapG